MNENFDYSKKNSIFAKKGQTNNKITFIPPPSGTTIEGTDKMKEIKIFIPNDKKVLENLVREYQDYRSMEDGTLPGESIFLHDARMKLIEYLDQNYDGDTNWAELYPVIKGDNVLVNRYWAFIEDFIK